MCGFILKDNAERWSKKALRREGDLVTMIGKGMLRWFGHVEMEVSRYGIQIHWGNVGGNLGKYRPRDTTFVVGERLRLNWEVYGSNSGYGLFFHM